VAESWFLKIDGIQGDSADKVHKGEIDVESWSWGVVHEGSPGSGGGGGAGRANFQDFHFVTKISKASPQLFLSCATGTHHKDATLSGSRPGDKSSGDFLKYKLSDVQVTSVQHAGGGSDVPIEQFSLSYGRFEITFTPQNPDGSAGSPTSAGFDVKMNKKV
jgi:type VI secretion system secreted protein Hcp